MICGGFARRSAPAPLAGASDCPLHPYRPNVGSGVFHSIVSGPLPRFFLLFMVRLRLFFSPCGVPGQLAFFPSVGCSWFVWRSCGVSLFPYRVGFASVRGLWRGSFGSISICR